MRVAGTLSEIMPADLACTAEEAEGYFAALGLTASTVERDQLLCSVEGWMAGLSAAGRLAGAVAAAGIAADVPALDTPVDLFRRILEVNVTGTFLFARAAGRAMRDGGGGGAILLVASVSGLRGAKGRAARMPRRERNPSLFGTPSRRAGKRGCHGREAPLRGRRPLTACFPGAFGPAFQTMTDCALREQRHGRCWSAQERLFGRVDERRTPADAPQFDIPLPSPYLLPKIRQARPRR